MTIAFWCVLVALLLPYVAIGLAKFHRGFDNRNPRDWEARQEGWKKRANFAHLNHFEAFAPFAAGVIIAHVARVPQATADAIAVTFVLARIAYTAAYLADKPTLRSLVWFVGFLCVIALFAAAAAAP